MRASARTPPLLVLRAAAPPTPVGPRGPLPLPWKRRQPIGWAASAPPRRGGFPRACGGPTAMLKAKILFVGPCESGKTVLANFLTESSDITEYNPTQGVRFESCWPALMKDSHGVVIVFNADIPSHLKEIEMWYSCFVQQQFLQDTQCLLIAHHKPGSGSDKGNPSLPTPLNKLKLVHSNLEDDPEDIRKFLKFEAAQEEFL
uniref:Intraflagellar transport 22 n=2 Tax=Canis lupus familiaris TaxID=9615 RepID=A0A8P0PQR0_CANLF